MGVQLRPITPLIKEFLQAIVWFNLEVIESVVQGIPVFFTKEINREIFLLPVAGRVLTKRRLVSIAAKGKIRCPHARPHPSTTAEGKSRHVCGEKFDGVLITLAETRKQIN
jgi:hypothetical protein